MNVESSCGRQVSKECILPVVSFCVERSILLKGLSKAKPHFEILRFDIRNSAVYWVHDDDPEGHHHVFLSAEATKSRYIK